MNRKYSAPNLKGCLAKASEELGIDESDIVYEITSEKKGLFKKEVEIDVQIPREEVDGKISVVDGKIIVQDPKDGGRRATISPTQGIDIQINGHGISGKTAVSSNDQIEWVGDTQESVKDVEVRITEDRVKVYLKAILESAKEFFIKEAQEMTDLIVGSIEKKGTDSEKLEPKEIVKALKKYKITTGLILENINSAGILENGQEILIAEGKAVQVGIDDRLILKYEENKIPFKDSKGNVDYKSIGHVDTIAANESVCELIKGKVEKNGLDVYGKIIKAETTKRINIIAGKGCRLEGDKVIAELPGKAMRKGYTFSIEPVYIVHGNVELSTGDVKYDGNVEVLGEVTEGMKVDSGSSVVIRQGASGAEIKAQNSITISGNVMTSKVASGGDEVYQKKIFYALNEIYTVVTELILMSKQVFDGEILGKDMKIGEVYKVLIERRFRKLKLTIEDYQKLVKIKYGDENELGRILEKTFLGFGPIGIKDHSQTEKIVEQLETNLSNLNIDIGNQSDMVLNYIQDSKIVCHGDVFINGKGEYVSEIISSGSIFFGENSVARGGYLKANDEIVCNVVGSTGRVRTTIHVEKKGKISIKMAYSNTKIIIGKTEYVIENDSTNLVASLDGNGEMLVEKLNA